tara:strand:+ start:222 stop:425 length:204 start_codon:yes stop_codon:yes gene_type:complete
MTKNTYTIIFIALAILALYLTRFEYGSYSYDKSFKSCIIAQKKIYKSDNIEEIKKFCEAEINKKLKK